MSSGKFYAQKILSIKQQEGKKIVLIQWNGCSIEQATWEPFQRFDNINSLIKEYQRSKVNDKVKNFAMTQSQKIDCGQNPYQQTSRHGHFMYGDEPSSIESIKIFKNSEQCEQRITIVCEIRWKDRVEFDSEGKHVYVILQNSFIDSKTVNEFRPDFLTKFYQSRLILKDNDKK